MRGKEVGASSLPVCSKNLNDQSTEGGSYDCRYCICCEQALEYHEERVKRTGGGETMT